MYAKLVGGLVVALVLAATMVAGRGGAAVQMNAGDQDNGSWSDKPRCCKLWDECCKGRWQPCCHKK